MSEILHFVGPLDTGIHKGCDIGWPSLVESDGSVDLYTDVFKRCVQVYGQCSSSHPVTHFRVMSRSEDTNLYLNVFQRYADVTARGKFKAREHPSEADVPTSSPFVASDVTETSSRMIRPFEASVAVTTALSSGISYPLMDAASRGPAQTISSQLLLPSCVRDPGFASPVSVSPYFTARPLATISSFDGRRAAPSLMFTSVRSIDTQHVAPTTSFPGRSAGLSSTLTDACSVEATYNNVSARSDVTLPHTAGRTTRRPKVTRAAPLPRRHTRRPDSSTFASTSSARPSYTYTDFGDCDQTCRFCGASFWYAKRLKGHSNSQETVYHSCCGAGSIHMPPAREPEDYMKSLFENRHFIENIRAYNQMFSMTSFGAKIDDSINSGRGPYVFKLSGQVYHWIGSLCPPPGEPPRFLQTYIYDTDHEIENRMRHFGGMDNSGLDAQIVEGLIHFLDAHNELVQVFRSARDKCRELQLPDFKIRLYNAEGMRGYELPRSNVLGAMVFDNEAITHKEFDVVIEHKDGPPQRVNKLHPSYMSLQFPLLFTHGESWYHINLKLRPAIARQRAKRVTMLAYYRYQLHFRLSHYDHIFRAGRLFQQYVVGVFCAIEQNWLDYIRKKQSDFRSDYLAGLYDAISRGEREGFEVGGRILLPMSFTDGPRYMYAHYLDALAICRKLGNPQFFVTFTWNVNWPEIKRFMAHYPLLTPSDRADVVCKIFEEKVKAFVTFIKEQRTFGTMTGVLYTIEFQKRGLPHCHTLVWVDSLSKVRTPEDVDRYISAELPNPLTDPQIYGIVAETMMHGPCGSINLHVPCMKDDRCSNKFPKKFNSNTFFDEKGHAHYRRKDIGVTATRNRFQLDNSYVVPYNRELLLAFQAHINVEYCGWIMLIKYLFKYISKGTYRVFAKVCRPVGKSSVDESSSAPIIDEIHNYLEGRFICAHEAYWRIMKFDIHHREPAVQVLVVHLEDMQRLTLRDNDSLQTVVRQPGKKATTLAAWLDYNTIFDTGRHLTYLDFPSEFVWHGDSKC